MLKAKPVGTASGIAVVAVIANLIESMNRLIIGPDSDFEYSTQNYTGYEPTSMRAIRARYNPNIQTRDRMA